MNKIDQQSNRIAPKKSDYKLKMADTSKKLPLFFVITGGTISGIGKGTILSSIGVVLKSMGFSITAIKIDPYLNVDAGNMSPYEHGEVFVLSDGGEVDLDLGNYERFLGISLTKNHNITTGKIYDHVIRKERKGEYLGKTVQVLPHITDAIIDWIHRASVIPVVPSQNIADICLIEVGGTVGDIESSIYLEALRQSSFKNKGCFCFGHVSFVPTIEHGDQQEQKTKPTQHGVKELLKTGLHPQFLFCRSKTQLSSACRSKISLFSDVALEYVISIPQVSNSYAVPLIIQEQNFGELFCSVMNLIPKCKLSTEVQLSDTHLLDYWSQTCKMLENCKETITIGIVGKYTQGADAYLSVLKALEHAAIAIKNKVKTNWIDSELLENNCKETWSKFYTSNGILCPGGFGDRGIDGKILAIKKCRENGIPFFGICLGLQVAVIEFGRNKLGLTSANSLEFDSNTPHPLITDMPELNKEQMGGTMRCGSYKIILNDTNSIIYSLYKTNEIYERHRHRFEINLKYMDLFLKNNMKFTGFAEDGLRAEVVEIVHHPFFLATQYHPEFTSQALKPNPCFLGFVAAAVKYKKEKFISSQEKCDQIPDRYYYNTPEE